MFKGWKKWEITWLLMAIVIITALSLYWKDTSMGIISSVTGVICVICTGKGKLSAYLFGVVNTLLYAIISLQAHYYGEVMLNFLYYFPMQFYGFYVWSKHMNPDTGEVIKRRMTKKQQGIMWAVILAGTGLYGLLLQAMGGSLPFVDAFSTVCSVAAMLISVKMFAEQWMIWIAVDVVTIIMWGATFIQGQENIATLLMWCVYLVNAVIMNHKWRKEANGV